MRYLVLLLISFFILGCGVESASSDSSNNSEYNDTDGGGTDGDGTDGNDSTGDDTTGDGTVVVNDPSEAGFNKSDAIEDPIACLVNNDYQAIEDTSFSPDIAADDTNGVDISSGYPFSQDLDATTVVLYYPTLQEELVGDSMLQVEEEFYRFAYDKAWSTSSNGTVYVRTPKDIFGLYGCYRYKLNSLNGDTIEKTKVYR